LREQNAGGASSKSMRASGRRGSNSKATRTEGKRKWVRGRSEQSGDSRGGVRNDGRNGVGAPVEGQSLLVTVADDDLMTGLRPSDKEKRSARSPSLSSQDSGSSQQHGDGMTREGMDVLSNRERCEKREKRLQSASCSRRRYR
jgi:hypothetical protein